MKPRDCFCLACMKPHTIEMDAEEYRSMLVIPGALQDDGRIRMACDSCQPLRYSTGPGPYSSSIPALNLSEACR